MLGKLCSIQLPKSVQGCHANIAIRIMPAFQKCCWILGKFCSTPLPKSIHSCFANVLIGIFQVLQ